MHVAGVDIVTFTAQIIVKAKSIKQCMQLQGEAKGILGNEDTEPLRPLNPHEFTMLISENLYVTT